MKKLVFILTALCFTCFSSAAFSQEGSAATYGEQQASSSFAWGVGLGSLIIISTMVGFIVSSSTKSPMSTGGQSH